MKLFNKEKMGVINYILTMSGRPPISKMYKLHIKDVGCNAMCPMCDDWKREKNIKAIEKGLASFMEVILKEPIKYKLIYIFGGEPLLIFDTLVDTIRNGTKYGIRFDFSTNGSLLSISKIDKLIEVGLDKFTFSLDFPDNKHDQFRHLPGAFEKIITFTNYIQDKGIPVQWNTVVGNFNCGLIADFGNLYKKCRPNIHDYVEVENNGDSSKCYYLDVNERQEACKELLLIKERYKNMEINLEGFKVNDMAKDHNHTLPCFVPLMGTHYYIMPDGSVEISPCYIDPHEIENDDIASFIKRAYTNGCNKCNSSHKGSYNELLGNVIKQYKLRSK